MYFVLKIRPGDVKGMQLSVYFISNFDGRHELPQTFGQNILLPIHLIHPNHFVQLLQYSVL